MPVYPGALRLARYTGVGLPDAPNPAIRRDFPAISLTFLGNLKLLYHYRAFSIRSIKVIKRCTHQARR
jgi:hypothetical protein